MRAALRQVAGHPMALRAASSLPRGVLPGQYLRLVGDWGAGSGREGERENEDTESRVSSWWRWSRAWPGQPPRERRRNGPSTTGSWTRPGTPTRRSTATTRTSTGRRPGTCRRRPRARLPRAVRGYLGAHLVGARLESIEKLPNTRHTLLERSRGAPGVNRLEALPGAEADEAAGILDFTEEPPVGRGKLGDRRFTRRSPRGDELLLTAGLHGPDPHGLDLSHRAPSFGRSGLARNKRDSAWPHRGVSLGTGRAWGFTATRHKQSVAPFRMKGRRASSPTKTAAPPAEAALSAGDDETVELDDQQQHRLTVLLVDELGSDGPQLDVQKLSIDD
jgi:hypothetical protein